MPLDGPATGRRNILFAPPRDEARRCSAVAVKRDSSATTNLMVKLNAHLIRTTQKCASLELPDAVRDVEQIRDWNQEWQSKSPLICSKAFLHECPCSDWRTSLICSS